MSKICLLNGKKEIDYIFYEDKISMSRSCTLSEIVIEYIKELQDKKDINWDKYPLQLVELIKYHKVFMEKLNTYVKQSIIELEFIKRFTYDCIYKSNNCFFIKLGIVLANDYGDKDVIEEIVHKYIYDDQYVFYFWNTIRSMDNYNDFLKNLVFNSGGAVKVFSIGIIDIIDKETNTYLIEEAHRDNKYGKLIIYLTMNIVKIDNYINENQMNLEKLENLAYVLNIFLSIVDFKEIDNKMEYVNKFIPLYMEEATGIEGLILLFRLKESIWSDYSLNIHRSELEYEIRSRLEEDSFEVVFLESITKGKGEIEYIIKLIDFYNFDVTIKDFIEYLKKEPLSYDIYWYFASNGSEDDKKVLLYNFIELVNLKSLTGYREDREVESSSNYYDIVFATTLKLSRKIYPQGKNLALKGLFGNVNDVRKEAIQTLRYYKDKLTEKEMKIVKNAYLSEPNQYLKNMIYKIYYHLNNEIKKNYVDIKEIEFEIINEGVYLLSTNVAGSQYVKQDILEETLNISEKYYLILEESNPYDKRAIRIVGDNGYSMGYVPKKDNYILSNLLKGGKRLYVKVKEFDLCKNYIRVRIYLYD